MSLSGYDGKPVRLTTEWGEVLTGAAEFCSAGENLDTFGRAEEGLQIDDTVYFLSQIAALEDLSAGTRPAEAPEDRDALMGELLEGPFWVADLLPRRVPPEAADRYFAVERYFRQPARQAELHRRQAELLLRLNCYAEMDVSFDGCETWARDPEPEAFVRRLEALAGNDFLRAVFPAWALMIDVEPGDSWMTVYCRAGTPPELFRNLAAAAGLFLWPGEDA